MKRVPSAARPQPPVRLAFPFLAACLVAACHPMARPESATIPRSGNGEIVITGAQMARMHLRTAWEAVKREVPSLTYTQDASGAPQTVQRRGRASLYLDQTPMLFVDGVHVSDISALQQIPAEQVNVIRVLTGLAATTEYGTHAGGGAILVITGRPDDSTGTGKGK
jgi:outer membrane receptor protein involved in Fe transport